MTELLFLAAGLVLGFALREAMIWRAERGNLSELRAVWGDEAYRQGLIDVLTKAGANKNEATELAKQIANIT